MKQPAAPSSPVDNFCIVLEVGDAEMNGNNPYECHLG
jgi:hypothetical protein